MKPPPVFFSSVDNNLADFSKTSRIVLPFKSKLAIELPKGKTSIMSVIVISSPRDLPRIAPELIRATVAVFLYNR